MFVIQALEHGNTIEAEKVLQQKYKPIYDSWLWSANWS